MLRKHVLAISIGRPDLFPPDYYMTYNSHGIFRQLDAMLSAAPRRHLSDVAQELHIERHTLETVVRKVARITFRQYRDIKLLECALSLLNQNVACSDKEIAARLGFRHSSSFCRFFKRQTGYTPSFHKADRRASTEYYVPKAATKDN